MEEFLLVQILERLPTYRSFNLSYSAVILRFRVILSPQPQTAAGWDGNRWWYHAEHSFTESKLLLLLYRGSVGWRSQRAYARILGRFYVFFNVVVFM